MTEADRPDERQLGAWRAFLRAHATLVDRLDAELQEEAGLPLSWYEVLLHLGQAPGRRLRLSELASRVLLSRSGITRLVDRMEGAGLIERQPCPDDRRGAYAALTDAGLARFREAAPVHLRGIEHHFARHLTGEEADAIRSGLERVAGSREAAP